MQPSHNGGHLLTTDSIHLGDTSSFSLRLAAAELRRYAWLRTGRLDSFAATLTTVAAGGAGLDEEIAAARALGPEGAVIRTRHEGDRNHYVIVGCDEPGALFAAYHLCEAWGIRFHLHGDCVPEAIVRDLPEVHADRRPLFAVRGLHPFHNFPEGPDGWLEEDYRHYLGQMTKLGMNFIGFHAYTSIGHGFEPQVWMGLPDDVEHDGRVRRAYPAANWHSGGGTWGYAATRPASMPLDADKLVAPERYADHAGTEDACELFNRIGARWKRLFGEARRRGMRCCLGLEIPLVMPNELREQLAASGLDPESREAHLLVWRGIFRRIVRTHPLDMFWLYVPEHWVWAQTVPEKDVQRVLDAVSLAAEALRLEHIEGLELGVMGWTIGPRNDPLALERLLPADIPLAALTPQVGHLPAPPEFAAIRRRPAWVIPWMEDDPRLTVPQLWAGRTLRDTADALALGCRGLLGIHWRTRGLSPQISALARSAWDQHPWNPRTDRPFTAEELEGFRAGEGQDEGTMEPWHPAPETLASRLPSELFATAAVGARYYRLRVPAGCYQVRCHLAEPSSKAVPGARRMSIAVNHRVILDKADPAETAEPSGVISVSCDDVRLEEDGEIEIFLRQIIGDTVLNAIEIEGHTAGFNQFEGVPYARRINCGGPELREGDRVWEAGQLRPLRGEPRPRHFDTGWFYRDWAVAEFGTDAGPEAVRIFQDIDGHLPCITFMREGPGNCAPDERPWADVKPGFAFVDRLAALATREMSPAEQERFSYWLAHFSAFRAAARVRCAAARPDETAELQSAWQDLYAQLIHAARSPGDYGTILSVDQQWRLRNLAAGDPGKLEASFESPCILLPCEPLNLSRTDTFHLRASVPGTDALAEVSLVLEDVAGVMTTIHPLRRDGDLRFSYECPATELPALFSYRIRVVSPGETIESPARTAIVEPS